MSPTLRYMLKNELSFISAPTTPLGPSPKAPWHPARTTSPKADQRFVPKGFDLIVRVETPSTPLIETWEDCTGLAVALQSAAQNEPCAFDLQRRACAVQPSKSLDIREEVTPNKRLCRQLRTAMCGAFASPSSAVEEPKTLDGPMRDHVHWTGTNGNGYERGYSELVLERAEPSEEAVKSEMLMTIPLLGCDICRQLEDMGHMTTGCERMDSYVENWLRAQDNIVLIHQDSISQSQSPDGVLEEVSAEGSVEENLQRLQEMMSSHIVDKSVQDDHEIWSPSRVEAMFMTELGEFDGAAGSA